MKEQPGLTLREQVLIGLGTSVAVGCLPYAGYYLRKAIQVGVKNKELDEAVATATRVRQRATDQMAWQVRRCLDGVAAPEPVGGPVPAQQIASLVALGAAYAVNSPPLLKRSIRAIRARGVSYREMTEALQIARAVKRQAMTILNRHAGQALGVAGFGCE